MATKRIDRHQLKQMLREQFHVACMSKIADAVIDIDVANTSITEVTSLLDANSRKRFMACIRAIDEAVNLMRDELALDEEKI